MPGSLRHIVFQLHEFIISVPFYYAAPAMIIIGAVDSSLISLPEINDYLVVARCYADPKSVIYFPLFAALGSVLGCTLLYTIVRKGGDKFLKKRFNPAHVARIESAYARYGILALAIPALMPPPMPFKIFVATAGALAYPRVRFMVTIFIARAIRYYIEGALAIKYGEHVFRFMRRHGLQVLGVSLAVIVVVAHVYVIKNAWRSRGQQPPAESEVT